MGCHLGRGISLDDSTTDHGRGQREPVALWARPICCMARLPDYARFWLNRRMGSLEANGGEQAASCAVLDRPAAMAQLGPGRTGL